ITRAPDLPLEGRTTPYAKVRVGGGEDWQELRAGADGHFRARVPLSEGENRLTVEVRDVMGQQITEDSEVMRDSTAPSATSTEVLWGR
ncbi:MAG: hypothetical protein QGG40_17525, partial [Myxococcota bacterium]|nr:hypothetical protein [Myxococcota bacterium]